MRGSLFGVPSSSEICAEKFARKRQLRRHMLLHLVETPTGSETPRPERHTGGKAAENNRLEPEELVPVETNTAKLSTMEPSKDVQECLTGSLLCPHHNCGKVFTSLEQLYRHLKRAAQREALEGAPSALLCTMMLSGRVRYFERSLLQTKEGSICCLILMQVSETTCAPIAAHPFPSFLL